MAQGPARMERDLQGIRGSEGNMASVSLAHWGPGKPAGAPGLKPHPPGAPSSQAGPGPEPHPHQGLFQPCGSQAQAPPLPILFWQHRFWQPMCYPRGPPLAIWVQMGQALHPPRPPSAAPAPAGTLVECCTPADLQEHMCSGPAPGTDIGERNTHRGGADTADPETYLEVLEAYWGGGGSL